MFVSLLSFNRRALRRGSVAAVALVAACDTDRPLAPTAASVSDIPTAAQPAVIPTGLGALAWTVVRQYTPGTAKILIGGAKFQVLGARINMLVTDNGANDSDGALGKFRLSGLQPGTFQLCQLTAPTGYVLPSPACHQLTVNANATTSDEFVNKSLPMVMLDMRDPRNILVGGGTVTFTDSVGAVIMTVTDNSAPDTNATAGIINAQLPRAGTFTMCPTTPPTGYSFWGIMCHTLEFKAGGGYGIGTTFVAPNPSVFFEIQDSATGNLILGGLYTVSIPNEPFSVTVADNGPYDLHAAVGKVLVKLPKAANYKVCEAQPPIGYKADQQPCRSAYVALGEPVWGGRFSNIKK